MPNAPKLNNAWWRWFGSGPRNPPVIIRLHGSAKGHRLGTIAGQRSRETALGEGAVAVIDRGRGNSRFGIRTERFIRSLDFCAWRCRARGLPIGTYAPSVGGSVRRPHAPHAGAVSLTLAARPATAGMIRQPTTARESRTRQRLSSPAIGLLIVVSLIMAGLFTGKRGPPSQTRTSGLPRLGEGPSGTWLRLRSAPYC
jgi:hypothetical protein